ncbi:DUF6868 family protein [Chitinimonas koreensis]|uniref:DUF6868 family protein n=1 Tax=Chitinimonas koreensis TaxID=356302 RepID=UPI0004111CAD|nr:hypothetical protein [Chitinimonas koreensis]QNM97758.1 hypothetical protein H9L41_05620 [Chitinimonas koreensis]
MDRHDLEAWLLACTLLNYGVLLCWFAVFALGHDRLRRLHGRWFALPAVRFDAIHYGAMAGYKLAILLFNLVPWLALRLTA